MLLSDLSIKTGFFILPVLLLLASPVFSAEQQHEVTIVVPTVMEMEFTEAPSLLPNQLSELVKKQEEYSSTSSFSMKHNNSPVKMVVEGKGKKNSKGFHVKATAKEPDGSEALSRGPLMILDGLTGFFPAQDALTNITRGIYDQGKVNWELWSDKVSEPDQTITVTFTIVNN